ncbi:MAG: TspO/MBR family protein [Pseudomonadota bacterium]
MTATERRPWVVYLLAIVIAFATASVGGSLTDLGDWYQNLTQPDWKPADRWFGPVWTTIFTLIAVAGATAWLAAPSTAGRWRVVAVFAANLLLNVGWSALFFWIKRPDWSLLEVGFLWLSIVVMIAVCWPRSRLASVLLTPYLAWVTFAAVLNYNVVALNGPF